MYMMARIYRTADKANAARMALLEAGYAERNIAMLAAPGAAPSAPAYSTESADGESAAPAPAPAASSADSTENALRVGSLLGQFADVYLTRMEPGDHLLVAHVPFMKTGVAENIFNAHDPRPINHEDPGKPERATGEADTPLSNWLGLNTISSGGPVMTGDLQDGTTHLSRWFPPLANNWTLSSKVGLSTSTKGATPLSSMVGLPTKSSRLEGKTSSFGIPLLSSKATPLSSMLGMRVLSRRKRYLYETYEYYG